MNSYYKDISRILELQLPWEKLSGCNILIVGATGLIGSCLVETLMLNPNKDYSLFITGRNRNRANKIFENFFNDSTFHYFDYDVRKELKVDIKFDYIIDAASNASPSSFIGAPVEVLLSNIYGVDNLLKYGKSHQLKRFLYISSGEIYGETNGKLVSESDSGYIDCTKVRSCYPSSKRAAETLCISYSYEYNIDVVIARPTHIYGPNYTESDNRVYAQFINNIIEGNDIVMKSSGSQTRSWCYVVDCVSALLYILLKGDNRQAYNVADNTSILSIKELATIIANISNRKVVFEMPSELEALGYNPVRMTMFSTKKLQLLGWNIIEGNISDKLMNVIECRNERNNF